MTIGRVAEMLGEDEVRLQHLAMDMDPEDGCLSVYGTNNLSTTAFTPAGIEFLRQMILDRKT